MIPNNIELAKFAINKVGTPYVMGTNGNVLTQKRFDELCKWNPNGWFTADRIRKAKAFIGKETTDCHGLIEWFLRDSAKVNIDITANMAYETATTKGDMSYFPDIPGTILWKPGHVGIAIGNGYAVEAKGIDYGTCVTRVADTKWEKWFDHSHIKYTGNKLPAPAATKISKLSPKYNIIWLQMALNRQIDAKRINVSTLVVDGQYGKNTASAVKAFWAYKKWSDQSDGYAVGKTTIKALM